VHDDQHLDATAALPAAMLHAFAETTRLLYVSEDLDETLLRVTTLATQTIEGCEVASLTMKEGGRLVTRAPTGDLALRCDEIQYEEGEGPCLDAALHEGLVHTRDSANDDRWPRFSRRVSEEEGVGGMLSCQLAVGDPRGSRALGGLNLYATRPDAYGEADRMLATLYAAHAAVIIDAARREVQLREAMASRDVIGQAKGILMAQGGVTADDAFSQLRLASQRLNVKLRDLASDVVARRSRDAAEAQPSEP
jgi:GAF domain-containing protein